MHTHTWEGSWPVPDMDSEPGKSKWFAKGNLEEMSYINDVNCFKGAALSLSPLVYLSTCIHFPSNKHFTCFNKIVAQKECYWQAHINETEVLSTPGETLVWSQCHLAFSGIVGCGSANFWMWNLSKNSMSWPNTLEQWQEPWTMQWRPGLPNFVGC